MSSSLLKNKHSINEATYQYEFNSSNDTETVPKKLEYPVFYMVPPSPSSNQESLTRSYLLSKMHHLIKFHKDEETALIKTKVGWHTVYEFFFCKIFFLKKRKKNYINMKEVQIRIRKEIGKLSLKRPKLDKKESYFTLFDKVTYNPPVSSWYEHNFLNDPMNKLLSPKDNLCFIPEVVKQFITIETNEQKNNNNKDTPRGSMCYIKRIDTHFSNNRKKRSSFLIDKTTNTKLRTTLNLNKFAKSAGKKNEMLTDTVTLQLTKIAPKTEGNEGKPLPFGLGKESKLMLKEVVIPKGAHKVVNKFIKDRKNTTFEYVEGEIQNIKNNEKAYEVEMRHQNIYTGKFIKANQFLFDFAYLKSSIDKAKKDIRFNLSNELEQMFKKIDSIVGINVNNAEGNEYDSN